MSQEVSRRSFVKLGAAGAALAGIAGTTGAALAAEPEWAGVADIVIAGGGGCGCTAALSAAENGASVICIEAGNFLGGASRLCVGSFTTPCTKMQAEAGIEDSYEAYEADARKFIGAAKIEHAAEDWPLFEIQIYEGGKTVDWLQEHGVEFNGPVEYPGHSFNRTHMLWPNAQAWPFVIEAEMEKYGVQIIKGTKVVEYLKDETGRVIGVRAIETATGNELFFKGTNAVIHAAGSIDNCYDWKCKVVSNELADMDPVNPFTDGSAFKALAAIGVDTTEWYSPLSQGMRTMGACDVGSTSKQAWMKFSIPQAGAILVNLEGKRYVNELASGNDLMVATNKQTARRSWMIFDDACASNFQTYPDMVVSSCPGIGWGTVDDFVANGGITKADTLEELAALIDVDAEGLAQTIEAWNAQCAAGGTDEFGRSSFGLEEAGTLGKGIVTAPFYAHGPQHGEMMFALVSARVTTDFQALDCFGEPIDGMYVVGAAGHGKAPMGGGGHGGNMTWVFTSGRLCGKALATGQSATAELLAQLHPAVEEAQEAPVEAPTYADGTYTGSGRGMATVINVTIQVKDGVITVVEIGPNNETKGLGGYEGIENGDFAAQIEGFQSADIAGIAGATLTSNAIRTAVAEALAQAAQ